VSDALVARNTSLSCPPPFYSFPLPSFHLYYIF
jgi:hypothetical protein